MRRGVRHGVAGALAGLVGALALGLVAGAAAGSGVKCVNCSGTYTGGTGILRSRFSIGVPHAQPTLDALRHDAVLDFRDALKDALGPCAQLALGLGVIPTGQVWMSASATAPGGIASGGAIIGTGEVMTSVATQLCAPERKRLLDDYRIFSAGGGPATSSIARRAVPAAVRHEPCQDLHGSVATFCVELRGRVGALVAAAGRSTAADDALLAAVQRAASTQRAGSAAAPSAQLQRANAAERQFQAALAAEASIGRTIRTLIPFGKLSVSQANATITYLEGRLAADGVTSAEIVAIDPSALQPAAEDPVSRLVDR